MVGRWLGSGPQAQRVQGGALAFLLLAAAPQASVTGAFARATAPGQDTGGVFLTITSPDADTLTGAATDVARVVSLHRTTMSGNVMQMRQMATVTLPAGKPVSFAPGGMHLMLEGLRHPLQRGETIHLTLHLAHAGAVAVDVPVAGPGARAPSMPGMTM